MNTNPLKIKLSKDQITNEIFVSPKSDNQEILLIHFFFLRQLSEAKEKQNKAFYHSVKRILFR